MRHQEPKDVFKRLNSEVLGIFRDHAITKQSTIATILTDKGFPTTQATVSRMMDGSSSAPAGAAFAILDGLDQPARVEFLSVLCERWGLAVHEDEIDSSSADEGSSMALATMQLVGAVGELAEAVRFSMADGSISKEERAEIQTKARDLIAATTTVAVAS